MEDTLSPILLTDEIQNRIIGNLIRNESYDELRDCDEDDVIHFHHTLGQWIRNTFIWKVYKDDDNMIHPDDISYEWIVETRNLIKSDRFNLEDWKDKNPECLI